MDKKRNVAFLVSELENECFDTFFQEVNAVAQKWDARLLLVDDEHQDFLKEDDNGYASDSILKTTEVLKNQQIMIDQLKEDLRNMKEKNDLLDEISKSDELTQIYNRRGFWLTVQNEILQTANRGKKAAVIYADMNNLKVVNDQFGHEEGDYSLRLVVTILKEALEEKTIVGRLGGDEFAAFLLTDNLTEKNVAKVIREKVAQITKEKNQNNDKPYFVSMSVGVCEFKCEETAELKDLLDKADVDLYIAKKYKRSNILKKESEAVCVEGN